MNVLDRLKEKARARGQVLTVIEQLILDCDNKQLQLEAAAELYELKAGQPVYDNIKDLTEIQKRQV